MLFETEKVKIALQHELGIFLRENINVDQYAIQFERNVSFFGIDKFATIKKEMDIVIYEKSKAEKYCIELKFPMNGQYPESMYSFIKDLKFCEQLNEYGFTGSISLVLVEDKLFYEGQLQSGIYQYFRNNSIINGNIYKPTGKKEKKTIINNKYRVEWVKSNNEKSYYLISLPVDENVIMETLVQDNIVKKVAVDKDVKRNTSNKTIDEVCRYIEILLNEAKELNKQSVTLVSGDLHKDLKMKNAMPTVCNAMRKIAHRYPNSIVRKPSTVKGQNSSTISIEYVL